MVGKGRAKAKGEEWDKDMEKTQTVEGSKRGREKEDVRVAKKERRKVMVEGGGEGDGGVEEGGGEGEAGGGGSKIHITFTDY